MTEEDNTRGVHPRQPRTGDSPSWREAVVLPWLLVVLLAVLFWVLEAGLHASFFDRRTFLTDLLRPDEHELWMRAIVVILLSVLAFAWAAVIRERTRRIRDLEDHEARLRAMSARLAWGESTERRELSDRLHEHVAQTLSAARMFLSTIEPQHEADRSALESAERILQSAIAECRDVAEELSPPVLDEYGLSPAVEQLASRVMRRTGVSVEVDATPDIALDRSVMLGTYEVVADALEDAVGDEQTTTIDIRIHCEDNRVHVLIQWDGSRCEGMFEAQERMLGVGGSAGLAMHAGKCVLRLAAPLPA